MQCHQLRLAGPVIDNHDLAKIRAVREGVFDPVTLPLVWPVSDGPDGLAAAVDRLCRAAAAAIDDGHNVLILSDRGVDARHVAIPSLLALSAVQQYLVAAGTRMQAGLVVETAEAREVHDIALLIGYGAAAVNPYLAIDLVAELVARDRVPGPADAAIARYVHAIEDGLRKVMSKMGISTIQSYRGAQIFEAVGLDRELVDRHFTGTPSRIGGIGLAELGGEALERHARGFGPADPADDELPTGGLYQWRRRGELHKWNPATIATLQAAVRLGDRAQFAEFERLCDDEDRALATLRGLFELVPDAPAIALDEVEPVGEIVKRFVTGAMSFGSISAEAHETPRGRDEPAGRAVQLRRGRRGAAPVRTRRAWRPAAQRDQAGRVGPVRGHDSLPGPRRGSADQDRARAPSRARAASCRATRSTIGSRGSGAPPPASP